MSISVWFLTLHPRTINLILSWNVSYWMCCRVLIKTSYRKKDLRCCSNCDHRLGDISKDTKIIGVNIFILSDLDAMIQCPAAQCFMLLGRSHVGGVQEEMKVRWANFFFFFFCTLWMFFFFFLREPRVWDDVWIAGVLPCCCWVANTDVSWNTRCSSSDRKSAKRLDGEKAGSDCRRCCIWCVCALSLTHTHTRWHTQTALRDAPPSSPPGKFCARCRESSLFLIPLYILVWNVGNDENRTGGKQTWVWDYKKKINREENKSCRAEGK